MIEFTPEAEARLMEYLKQVRAALAGSPDVSPDEIEADIREHVENELRAAPAPVGVHRLERVLDQLGPPAKWGAAEGPTLLQRVKQRLRLGERLRTARDAVWRGPEDWRLAYLSFGVFAIGALTIVVFPLALVVSYILSRAGIAAAREKGVELGAARKWLLYPPVVLVSLALLIGVVAWPVAAGVATGAEVSMAAHRVETFDRPNPEPANRLDWRAMRDWQYREQARVRMASQIEEDRQLLAAIPVRHELAPVTTGLFIGAGAVAVWWTVLGLLGATFPRAVRAVFVPLCDRFERRHGLYLAAPAFAVAVIWCVAAFEVASAAGAIG
jgi:hypothetical protein